MNIRATLALALTAAPERLLRSWIVNAFHRAWYDSHDTWRKNTFLGYTVQQQPMDLWLYQEIIVEQRPEYVLQTGVSLGGSMVFFAHMLDLIGAPPEVPVIGVDVVLTPEAKRIDHPRVRLVEGSSVAPETIERVRALLPAKTPRAALVSLDSDHRRDHVLREMELYGGFVPKGSYLVVEDTNVNGNPVAISHGPGPMEAIDAYLRAHHDFERDEARWERNLFSFHQGGWLRRV